MDPLQNLSTTSPPLPVPDRELLSGFFTSWGIWVDPHTSQEQAFTPREISLGWLLSENQVNLRRFLTMGIIFGVLGPGIMLLSFALPEVSLLFLVLGGLSLGWAIYNLARLVLNEDLRLRIFRNGFSLRRQGKLHIVTWKEIAEISEDWRHAVYQGFIRIHIHRLFILLHSGEQLVLDRRLQHIDQISHQLQIAVTQSLYPTAVKHLQQGDTLSFGPFEINRRGIAYQGKKALPWNQVQQVNLQRYGDVDLWIHRHDAKKLELAWVKEKGRKIPNLRLLVFLAEWFMIAARTGEPTAELSEIVPPAASQTIENGIFQYSLEVTKKQAIRGSEISLYVGSGESGQSLELVLPPGTQTGREFRFPGLGPDDPQTGQPSELLIRITVQKKSPGWENRKTIQQTAGIMIIILAYVWLGFFSPWAFWPRLGLSALIGGLGGAMVADRRWRLGLLCGVVGGAISLGLQDAYYLFNYLQYGRTTFWNYETVLVLAVSLAPGLGMYYGLLKMIQKREERK